MKHILLIFLDGVGLGKNDPKTKETLDFVKNKIKGKLEECGLIVSNDFQQNLHQYSESINCTEQEALNTVCKNIWANAEW